MAYTSDTWENTLEQVTQEMRYSLLTYRSTVRREMSMTRVHMPLNATVFDFATCSHVSQREVQLPHFSLAPRIHCLHLVVTLLHDLV